MPEPLNRAARNARNKFATDSLPEGDGFETLVLRHKTRGFPEHPGIAGVSITREG